MPSPSTTSASATSTFASCAAWPTSFRPQTWSEEALNHLATHYIVADDDAKADETFREMFARFPSGRYAERAAWKIGWLAYRNRQYAETIRVFERGVGQLPAIGLPPGVAVLVGAGVRGARAKLSAPERATRLPRPTITTATTAGSRARGSKRRRIPPSRWMLDEEDASGESLPPNQELVRALLGRWTLRSGHQGAAVRPEGLGRLVGDSSDARLDLSEAGPGGEGRLAAVHALPQRDQHDEARVSAVSRRRGRAAAERGASDHLPARLLGSDQEVLGRQSSRSVSGRGARRAGIHLCSRYPVIGQGRGADAAHARRRPGRWRDA